MPWLTLAWNFRYAIGAIILIGAGWAYLEHRDSVAEARGAARVQALWDKDKIRNAAAVVALDKKYRDAEKENAAHVAAIEGQYAQDIKNLKARSERDLAAVRAGTLRLSFPTAPNQCPAPEAGSGKPGNPQEARTELPTAIAADLLALAADADEVVLQLTACQGVLEADRQEKGGDL